jgi:hypothetical protein
VQTGLVVGVGDGRCQVVPHRVGVSHTIRPPYAARGTLARHGAAEAQGGTLGAVPGEELI